MATYPESMISTETSLVDYPIYPVDFGLIDHTGIDNTYPDQVFQDSPQTTFHLNSNDSRSSSSNFEPGSYQSGTSQLQQQQKASDQLQSNSSGHYPDHISTSRMGATVSAEVSNWLQPRPTPNTNEELQQIPFRSTQLPGINPSCTTVLGSWVNFQSAQQPKQQTLNRRWSPLQHVSRNVNPTSPAGSVVIGGFSQGFHQMPCGQSHQPQRQEEMKHRRSTSVASTEGGDIQAGHQRRMSITSTPNTVQPSTITPMQHRNDFVMKQEDVVVPAPSNVSRSLTDYDLSNPASRFIRKSSPQHIPVKRHELDGEMMHTHTGSGSWDGSLTAEAPLVPCSPSRRGTNGFHSPLRELSSSPAPAMPANISALQPEPAQEGYPDEQERGLLLVSLLVRCADAISKKNQAQAISLIDDLSHIISQDGDSMQRVASYFTYGLLAHIANTATGSSLYRTLQINEPTAADTLDALQAFSNFCPFMKFGAVASLQTILEAFQGEQDVQWIDLGMVPGSLWLPCQLLRGLASRSGGPPTMIYFTGVQVNSSDDHTSRQLKEFADTLNLNFIFQSVSVERLADLEQWMLASRPGQALAVSCSAKMHTLLYDDGNRLNNVLATIHNMSPKVFCILEQEASHNVPAFLARFLEALHFYSAIFDSLEATLPRISHERTKIEKLLLGQEIINIVSRDGKERVERHERWQHWRNRMARAGFRQWPHSEATSTHVKNMMRDISYGTGFSILEDQGSLILNWQDRPLFTSTAWTSC